MDEEESEGGIETTQKIYADETETAQLFGKVIFTKGAVFDIKGQVIRRGAELDSLDELLVESNGFLSIQLSDGRILNIQPNTSTNIALALRNQSDNLEIQVPYFTGGVRG